MTLKIATWNINSIRLRMPLLKQLVERDRPDLVCLQETKVRDAEFPFAAVQELGFDHVEIAGQKGYHGVATLSRLPFGSVDRGPFCRHGHARHLAVTLSDRAGSAAGLTVHNFYVPAGGDEPDPAVNPKFAHKLHFIEAMAQAPASGLLSSRRSVLVGDLNIAPLETDVWSHKALLKIVSHTPLEVAGLIKAQRAARWVDAMRQRVPPHRKLYTWWSYRSPNWAVADKGRRLDHVWLSQDLSDSLGELSIVKAARGWDKPSDHVPVMIDLHL